jgi:hypothetical protein
LVEFGRGDALGGGDVVVAKHGCSRRGRVVAVN